MPSTTQPSENIPKEHYLTHFPKLASCEICQRAKSQRATCKRKKRELAEKTAENGEDSVELECCSKFGDLLTADHAILGDPNEESREGDKVAMIIQDSATKWIDCYPSAYKSMDETMKALQNYVGPKDKVKRLYSDNSGEIEAAILKLQWRHDTSTPNRPQTNGVAEGAVRRVLEGTRAVLL